MMIASGKASCMWARAGRPEERSAREIGNSLGIFRKMAAENRCFRRAGM